MNKQMKELYSRVSPEGRKLLDEVRLSISRRDSYIASIWEEDAKIARMKARIALLQPYVDEMTKRDSANASQEAPDNG